MTDLSPDQVFDAILAELEAALDLCASADRDQHNAAILAHCKSAARLAGDLAGAQDQDWTSP